MLTFAQATAGPRIIISAPSWYRSCTLTLIVTAGPWSIVLAAGAGRRLAALTGGVPKQFWRPDYGPSLLATTLARLAPLAEPERTVVIVDDSHRSHVASLSRDIAGTVLFQPTDRGTATGVLMALMPVLEADPNAIVIVTPSDHGVLDDERFRRGVLEAAGVAQSGESVVLFGVKPTRANGDYGWIVPECAIGRAGLRPVRTFVEKPPASMARQLLDSGAVWNTMIVVATAAALRTLYAQFLPELARLFEAALQLAPTDRECFLSSAYPSLRSWDFSRDLLTPARNLLVYTWPEEIGWSDLGTPDRLQSWLSWRAEAHLPCATDVA